MKFDTSLLVSDLSDMPALAQAAEAMGFAGIWVAETALAFSRSPAVLAYLAWDLARFSRGRFILGLGTQITGRFP